MFLLAGLAVFMFKDAVVARTAAGRFGGQAGAT
jgi:hypothetical protein